MDPSAHSGPDDGLRALWTKTTDDLQISEIKQLMGKNLTRLCLDGVEALTDEILYIVQKEGIASNILEFSCVGCVHITDYGVSLIAQAAPLLKKVVLDGCRDLTATSLRHLSTFSRNITSLSMRGTSVTHVPLDISEALKAAITDDSFLGCPLITEGITSSTDADNQRKCKLVIFANDQIECSVMSFLSGGSLDKGAKANDKISYHRDVKLSEQSEFNFNVYECHVPRTMYPPMISPGAAYVFAMNVALSENPLITYMSMLSSIKGQVGSFTLQVLCLHKGESQTMAVIVELIDKIKSAETRQRDIMDGFLEEDEYCQKSKFRDQGRDFQTQLRYMKAKENKARRIMVNIYSVNTVNQEVELLWPKRDTAGKLVKEEGDGETDKDENNTGDSTKDPQPLRQISTGYSVEELKQEEASLRELCEKKLAEVLPHLESAEKAMNSLSKAHISEIKSMSSPPAAVLRTLGTLAVLLKYGKADWVTCKKMMSKPSFMDDVRNFDKESLTAKDLKLLEKYEEELGHDPKQLMKYSMVCGVMAQWLSATYKFGQIYRKELCVMKAKLQAIHAQIDKIENSKSLLGKGPSIIQGILEKDLSILHTASLVPKSTTISTVSEVLERLKDNKIVPLHELLRDSSLEKIAPRVVRKVLEYFHDLGSVIFLADGPDEPVITDIPWFVDILTKVHLLNNEESLENKSRVRIMGPKDKMFKQSDFLSLHPTTTDDQVRLVFAALEEIGILIRIPMVFIDSPASTDPMYFSFANVEANPYVWESHTDGRNSGARYMQRFWSDVFSDEGTVVLEQSYKFTSGMPLSLFPRIIAEVMQMGFTLEVSRWEVTVRHGACEFRLKHNIHMGLLNSSLDLELRTFAAEPSTVIYDYMWSIFSYYILITEYHIQRFKKLSVRVKIPCRGSCAATRFPQTFNINEIPRKTGFRMECPKCQEDNMTEAQTLILLGRRHMLPFHNFVEGTDVQEADNPNAPFNFSHTLLENGSQSMWRCFVCHTVQTASLRLWEYETNLYPSFAISCMQLPPKSETSSKEPFNMEGNILTLNEDDPFGVTMLKECFGGTGVTSFSLTPMSQDKVTVALGYASTLEKCMDKQNFKNAFHVFELHSGKFIDQHREVVKELELISPFDTLSLHVVGQKFTSGERGTTERLQLQFRKNGSPFASEEFVYPLSLALMVEHIDSSKPTHVLINCPTFPVVRAHHFPLKGALLQKLPVSQQWTVGEVVATGKGEVHVADSMAKVVQSFPADSDDILPVCYNMNDITVVLETGNQKEVLYKAKQFKEWLETHGAWPVPTCLFSRFLKSKAKTEYNRMVVGELHFDSWRCSASRHSPEVLHASILKQPQLLSRNKNLSTCVVVLPSRLDGYFLHNPHRNLAHDMQSQSIHFVCPGMDLGITGFTEFANVADAHFLGVPPTPLKDEEVKNLLAKCSGELTYTYMCLLRLKNVVVPFEGCTEPDVAVMEKRIKEYMHTYLATTILLVWLRKFPKSLKTWKMEKYPNDMLLSCLAQNGDAPPLVIPKHKPKGMKGKKINKNLCSSHLAVLAEVSEAAAEDLIDNHGQFVSFVRSLSLNKRPQADCVGTMVDRYLRGLTNLVILQLENCGLSDLPGLDRCHHLIALRLSQNEFTAIPPELCHHQSSLQELDMRYNPVTVIPDFLCSFTSLEKLSLSYIRTLPDDFGNLQKLQFLYLDRAFLTRLPASFRNLRDLETLTICNVPWPDVTTTVGRTAWSQLYHKFHGIALGVTEEVWMKLFDDHDVDNNAALSPNEMPGFLDEFLRTFPRLGQAEPSNPHAGKMPSEICYCRRLRFLTLCFTAIEVIPDSISNLQKLVVVNLRDNILLESISTETGKLRKLKDLKVQRCPKLRTPPREIVSQGNSALIAYLRRLSQGSVACYRTKLMFVGLGGAGKTSLMRALMSKDGICPEVKGEGITDGIDITNWSVQHMGKTLTFNVWDFAGQTVYYNTHQFFLSKRAVYILVWNTRLGFEHSGLDFWLSSIACHTPKAPIFIVGTHADQISKSEIPQQKLRARFPNIVSFMRVSSRSGEGVLDLLNKLIEVTFAQPYIGERIPEAWLSLEKLILSERAKSSLMDWDEVNKIAVTAAISGREVQRAVSFLHELGTLQYFDNDLLKDWVVINPQWIVDVMACVVSVHDSPIKEGHLQHEDIKTIWKDYPEELHNWLLHLTEVFDLTFPLPDRKENIVPCLLPKEEPEIKWPQLNDTVREMKMVYTFDYLPAGLFNRAQVRLYEFSDSSTMWKEGSILKKNDNMALVKQTKDNEVMVTVVGVMPENVFLIVHEVFEGLISESFQGVKYDYHLPCRDCINAELKEPAMFSSKTMNRAVQMQALFLQCHVQFHTLSISSVQQALLPASNTDYALQLDDALRGLDDLSDELAYDVFFLYSMGDVPSDVMDEDVLHPKRLANDLQAAGYKCLYQENLENQVVEDLISLMRKCKAVASPPKRFTKCEKLYLFLWDSKETGKLVFLIFISDGFTEDTYCQRLFTFLNTSMDAETILIMVGKGREWKKSNIGMVVSEQVYINFQRMNQYDDRLKNLMEKLNQKLGRSTSMEDSTPPDVFLSYCWSNSATSIAEGIARPKDGSVGAGDPREIKKFLEDNGLKVWLDLEQTGRAGLFEDISVGMKNAKVVVACVSDEYVLSDNCQMEFRFAHIALRMPIVIVIVGTGFQWEATEVGMLSLGYPKVNFQVANNLAHKMLLEHVMERVASATGETKIERSMSVESTSMKEMAFQELYELAQRKFLRQIASYTEASDPYPHLFVADLNYDPAGKPKDDALAELDNLDIAVEFDVQVAPQRLSSVDDIESGMFCIKTLCEHEGGWHSVTDGVPVDVGGSSLMKIWQMTAPYMARMLAILKHSNVNLHVIQHPEGGRVLDILEKSQTAGSYPAYPGESHPPEVSSCACAERNRRGCERGRQFRSFNPLLACYELTSGGCDSPVYAADNFGCLLKEQQLIITLSLGASLQPQVDLQPLYTLIRQYVMAKDRELKRGNLTRCYLPSGKVLWLCEKHRSGPRVTVLSEEDTVPLDDISSDIPESVLLAGLAELSRLIDDKEKEDSGAPTYTRPISARPVSAKVKGMNEESTSKGKNAKPPKGNGQPTTEPKSQIDKTPKAPHADKQEAKVASSSAKSTTRQQAKTAGSSAKSNTKRTPSAKSSDKARISSAGNKSASARSDRSAGAGSRPATMEEKANIASKIAAANVSTTHSQACVVL